MRFYSKLSRKKQLGRMVDTTEISRYKLWNSNIQYFHRTLAQKMKALMRFAMDSKQRGTVNPEIDLSYRKKQRFLDDETNRHGMNFNQSPYFQRLNI